MVKLQKSTVVEGRLRAAFKFRGKIGADVMAPMSTVHPQQLEDTARLL